MASSLSASTAPGSLGLCLVTGGVGYTGSRIAQALVARAERVRVLDLCAPKQPIAGVEYVVASLTSEQELRAALAGVTTVFHTAALIQLASEACALPQEKAAAEQVNVHGTNVLLGLCRELGVTRLVHTSSINVVFEDDAAQALEGIDESTPYARRPVDVYSRTKIEAERAVRAADGPSFSTCAIRPGMIYGPGERHHLPRLVRELRAGRFVMLIGPRGAQSDSSYIDNLVDAHLRAAERLSPGSAVAGQAYFITDGTPQNYFELLRPLIEGLGHRMPRLRVPLGPMLWLIGWLEWSRRHLGVPRRVPMTRLELLRTAVTQTSSIARARRDLGYVPLCDAREGIRRTLPYCRELHAVTPGLERPHAGFWLGVLGGMTALGFVAFHGPTFAWWHTYVVSALPRVVYQGTFALACAIHVIEAGFAHALAKRAGTVEAALGWALQTLLLGGFSLRLLLAQTRRS